MQPLRIAQVMASGPVHGGLEKHFVDLCTGLSSQHEVLAVAHRAHAQGLSKQVVFQPFDMRFSRRSPWNLFRLHRALKDFGPDVIHAHANKAAAMVSVLSRFTTAKTVGTAHGFKRDNRAFASFDAVIAVSRAIQDHLGLPQAQVIFNGIPRTKLPSRDPHYFLRQFGLSQERPVVVSIGRLAAVKGFSGLINAWSEVDADLLIVGEGPERDDLQRLIAERHLKDRVQLVGYRDDVPAIMSHSDLVVISSEREGFPYVMVEALHLDKVIVATEFPGAASILPEGYVVPYGQPSRLRAAVVRTLEDKDQASRDYQATWAEAKRRFTVESMVESTSSVYGKLFRAAA